MCRSQIRIGQVVGDEQALRGEVDDLLAEGPILRELAEDVAAGDVHHLGELAQDRPLRPLAAARHAEEEDRPVLAPCGHRVTSSTVRAATGPPLGPPARPAIIRPRALGAATHLAAESTPTVPQPTHRRVRRRCPRPATPTRVSCSSATPRPPPPTSFHGAESDVGLGARGFEQAEAAGPGPRPRSARSRSTPRPCSGPARPPEPIARRLGVEPVAVADLHERRMGPLSGARLVEGWDAYVAAMERLEGGRPRGRRTPGASRS